MTAPSPLSRPSRVALFALLLTAPVWAFLGRPAVLFLAKFEADEPPGYVSSLEAEVGKFVTADDRGVFSNGVDADGNGVLSIVDPTGVSEPAVLVAQLDQDFSGLSAELRFDVVAGQQNSSLWFRAEDDNNSGMIDGGIDDNGGVKVNGNDTDFEYLENVRYHIELRLNKPLFGPVMWALEITWDPLEGGGSGLFKDSGFLPGKDKVALSRILIVKPADSAPGTFTIDNLLVVGSTQFGLD